MDLARFVTESPPEDGRRGSWLRRFEEIIGQGLAGEWINATAAWGTKPNGRQTCLNAAERAGLGVEWRTGEGQAYLRVKG
jgi:hypothetical protein